MLPLCPSAPRTTGRVDRNVTTDQLMACSRHTASRFTFQQVPGDHFFPLTSSAFRETFATHVAALLRQLE